MIAFGSIVAWRNLWRVLSDWLGCAHVHVVFAKFLRVLLIPILPLGSLSWACWSHRCGAEVLRIAGAAQAEGLELSGGLLKNLSSKSPCNGQMLEGSSSVLQRLVGFETFKVHQARAQSDPSQGGVNMAIPGLESDHAERLNAMLFPPFSGEKAEVRPHRLMLIRMLLIRAAVVSPVLIWGEVWMQVCALGGPSGGRGSRSSISRCPAHRFE